MVEIPQSKNHYSEGDANRDPDHEGYQEPAPPKTARPFRGTLELLKELGCIFFHRCAEHLDPNHERNYPHDDEDLFKSYRYQCPSSR